MTPLRTSIPHSTIYQLSLLTGSLLMLLSLTAQADDGDVAYPRSSDDRFLVELVASEPDIVTPFGITVDAKGRVFVVESHTHMRPDDYDGPTHDRIRLLVDTDGDGLPEKISTYYEGEKWLMNVAAHSDGWLYAVSRNELFRIRDNDGDGHAELRESLAKMETDGDYPHNGFLSVTIGADGNIYFGMGQNFGAAYVLTGRDGRAVASDRGDGGIFLCSSDGKGLVRLANGFWNPCGIATDAFGRLFTVDNDPGNRPPCRLIEVVAGGDYGYRRHELEPFISWNGELPGTLPMIASLAEAPTDVITYAASAFPLEYHGKLLVSSWSEYRIDSIELKPHGATFSATSRPLVVGGPEFRPVGMAVAPDGSLYVSDWVDRSYPVHGRGRVWRIRAKEPNTTSSEPTPAAAGRRERSVRTQPLQALDLRAILSAETGARLQAAALRRCTDKALLPLILKAITSDDPFLRQAATQALKQSLNVDELQELVASSDRHHRFAALLALRAKSPAAFQSLLSKMLDDSSESIQYLAIDWIAHKKLAHFRPPLVERLETESMSARLFEATCAAIAHIDGVMKHWRPGKNGDWWKTQPTINELATHLLSSPRASPETLRRAIELLPAGHPALTIERLVQLIQQPTTVDALQIAVVRALPLDAAGRRVLRRVAHDVTRSAEVRAEAVLRSALFLDADVVRDLVEWAESAPLAVRREALRSLRGAQLTFSQVQSLQRVAGESRDLSQLVALVLDPSTTFNRPALEETDAWMKRIAGPVDPRNGARIFFHPNGPGCAKCHHIDGRGQNIGPEFHRAAGGVAAFTRRSLLEAILQPSREIALGFVPYKFLLEDGHVKIGVLETETDTHYKLVDSQGNRFSVKRAEIEEMAPSDKSIMPDGLVNTMTDSELRDLIAYLLLTADESPR